MMHWHNLGASITFRFMYVPVRPCFFYLATLKILIFQSRGGHQLAWMPLSNSEKLKPETGLSQRKRRQSGNNHLHSDRKRSREELARVGPSTMGETTPKRANFSAINPSNNGFTNRSLPLINNKPGGGSKKLVIKNFKGEISSNAISLMQ